MEFPHGLGCFIFAIVYFDYSVLYRPHGSSLNHTCAKQQIHGRAMGFFKTVFSNIHLPSSLSKNPTEFVLSNTDFLFYWLFALREKHSDLFYIFCPLLYHTSDRRCSCGPAHLCSLFLAGGSLHPDSWKRPWHGHQWHWWLVGRNRYFLLVCFLIRVANLRIKSF